MTKKWCLNIIGRRSLANSYEIFARFALEQPQNLNKSQLRILDNELTFDPVMLIGNNWKFSFFSWSNKNLIIWF